MEGEERRGEVMKKKGVEDRRRKRRKYRPCNRSGIRWKRNCRDKNINEEKGGGGRRGGAGREETGGEENGCRANVGKMAWRKWRSEKLRRK